MDQSKKRTCPPMIKNILDFDCQLTEMFVKYAEKCMPLRQLQIHCAVLEISCHGIIWIASLLALIWILHNSNLYQMQVNLLLGLVIDVIVIAVLKATFRRKRPVADPSAMGPDIYSFPSGHCSRVMLLFYFFNYLWPVPGLCLPPLVAWLFAVPISRLLIRRHNIIDVIAGLLIGYLEGMFLSLLYLNPQTCLTLVSFISDEKIPGPEYDV